MTTETADVFIIGGGINGAGIARDASGRGQKVILVEQGDLASATSSASSKLIHGGLRYLEQYDFKLVRDSLLEREALWKIAPHLIKPLRFILPHHSGLRPWWLLRLGLFLYDHIGGRKLLPVTKSLDLATHKVGGPLKEMYSKAFEYSDCAVDDARLVILNALDATQRGATILTRHRFLGAKRQDGWWIIDVENQSGQTIHYKAKSLVNAAGPWVDRVLKDCHPRREAKSHIRLVKGSHIIVPKLYDHDKAYTFQSSDGRIIFSIPYEGKFTLIGTTDVPFESAPSRAAASRQEIEYLCTLASEYFKSPIHSKDVISTYSGVRALYDDGKENSSKTTRKYILELDAAAGALPLVSVFGGKLTSYRHLSEDVLEKLSPFLKLSQGKWTKSAPLPGGDMDGRENPESAIEQLMNTIGNFAPWLDPAIVVRLAQAYGTRAFDLLDGVHTTSDLGQYFGAGLYEAEVTFLMRTEWAQSCDDILWRRSKLGLHMNEEEKAILEKYMQK